MESLRSLITGKKKTDTVSDETIFREELLALLKPHVQAVMKEVYDEDGLALYGGPIEETVAVLHEKLLTRFFSFAKEDPGLKKFMFPIMMYLRKSRGDRLKAN